MVPPLILPLSSCTESTLVGGKAVGLARLLTAGFRVPPGICVTTEAYRQGLETLSISTADEWQRITGLSDAKRQPALLDCQSRIRQADVSHLAARWTAQLQELQLSPMTRWAVRSSATNEDAGETSFAGVYRTHLGVLLDQIEAAVKDLWASVWQDRVVEYVLRRSHDRVAPAMAVVIQPMLAPHVAGVAYSIHPVTGRSSQVVVNAVMGLAAPLVDGDVSPDQYVVDIAGDDEPMRVRRRHIEAKAQRLMVTDAGLVKESIPEPAQRESSLSDRQLCEVADVAKRIERSFHHPVDLEWAIDAQGLWILQARPITGVRPSPKLTNDDCEWSRTNFKETMPELPSPMGLSFLERFMDRYIIAPYRRLGCTIPEGVSSCRILQGRPYINVTLFHLLVGQLRGDPSLLSEQMGGQPLVTVPDVRPLGWISFVRAGIVMLIEMRRATHYGPTWFAEMKQLATTYRSPYIETLSFQEVATRLDELGRWLDEHELTFGIAGGVSQCLQVLGALLPKWLGPDWRALLNAALQGQGTVISAQQITRLADLADIARKEPRARDFLTAEPWHPVTFRAALHGTAFLSAFESFLADYGHRGLGESDVMSPRFADEPESILAVLRAQLRAASATPQEIHARQETIRTHALATITQRFGWRLHRRVIFRWWYRRLCRFFALREANRHHLMYYSAAARNLLLRLGEILVDRGVFDSRDDIFLLTLEERARLALEDGYDWRGLVRARRTERARHAAITVPDTIVDWESISHGHAESHETFPQGLLRGMPISAGSAVGPIRVIRSMDDWKRVLPGDILVTPVIDPGMAPLFGLAGGLIAEMGGTLSHGAIIAREYGLPTVANVDRAMALLKEGQRVSLDAGTGTIRLEPLPHS